MKIEAKTVLEYLKPKVKALGFKKEILEGLAADVAENLEEVDDDASEEDINAKIKPAVDAVIPSLKFAQRMANFAVEEYRKKQEKANEPEPQPEPKQDLNPKPKEEPKPKPSSTTSKKDETEETPAWVKELIEANKTQMEQQKQLIESLKSEVDGIKSKSTAEKRRSLLEELLKDTGTFGKRTLKSFEKMNFETEEEFNEFVSEVKEDLEQLNQERADEGLKKFGAPKVDTNPNDPPKPKVLSDTELEELANNL